MTVPEYKTVKFATGFGMVRTAAGYTTRELLNFALCDDSKMNAEIVNKFAKDNKLDMVEVWYREDCHWDEIRHYKTYTYFPDTITEKQLDGMNIYKRG